jgi:hypothetical protein
MLWFENIIEFNFCSLNNQNTHSGLNFMRALNDNVTAKPSNLQRNASRHGSGDGTFNK